MSAVHEGIDKEGKLVLRVRYADMKGHTVKMGFNPNTTGNVTQSSYYTRLQHQLTTNGQATYPQRTNARLVKETLKLVVNTGAHDRIHTQPKHIEAYGIHLPLGKKGRMKMKKEKKDKAKFRDTRIWLDGNHSLAYYKLQDGVGAFLAHFIDFLQDEIFVAVKYIHLVQAQKVKIVIPFFNDLEVDFEYVSVDFTWPAFGGHATNWCRYDYNTTVADAIDDVVAKAKEREREKSKGKKEKKDKKKKKGKEGGDDDDEEEQTWEVFLPIGREDKTLMGTFLERPPKKANQERNLDGTLAHLPFLFIVYWF